MALQTQWFCFFVGVLVSLSSVTNAELYKWTDDNGRVHFSDKPPVGQGAKDVSDSLKNINISAPVSSSELLLKHAEERDRKRKAEYEAAREKSRNLPNKEQVCQEAKKNLRILEGRVIFLDDNGQEVKVTEKERQRRAVQLKEEINKYCS